VRLRSPPRLRGRAVGWYPNGHAPERPLRLPAPDPAPVQAPSASDRMSIGGRRLRDLTELFPLFLSEARQRVGQLLALAPQLVSSPAALASARRELHTLRGASRLIGYGTLAELSLEGEALLQSVDDSTAQRLAALAERMVASLSGFEAAAGGAFSSASEGGG